MERTLAVSFKKYILNFVFAALWATRQTEDTEKDRELHVKTTLRELVVYIVFLVILCVGM